MDNSSLRLLNTQQPNDFAFLGNQPTANDQSFNLNTNVSNLLDRSAIQNWDYSFSNDNPLLMLDA